MDFKTILDWVLARMAEPTTWRGLIGLAAAAGVVINPHYAAMILAGGMGLAGFIGVVSKDPKNIAADVQAALDDIVIPVVTAMGTDANGVVANATVTVTVTPPAA
jgi:hypothetical protein